MSLAQPLEAGREQSPLAAARLHRRLTREEAARRAGITADEVAWLEEGRVYRFGSADDALLATLLLATALGIDHREALQLAGRPVPALPLHGNPLGRVLGLGALAAALALLCALFVVPSLGGDAGRATPAAQPLPPTWKISTDVLNGSGDINYTRRVASRIGALAYHVEHVGRADRFDYRRTAVYYEAGGQAIAIRLARQLRAVTKPLPGGSDPLRLVVIVGPHRGPA